MGKGKGMHARGGGGSTLVSSLLPNQGSIVCMHLWLSEEHSINEKPSLITCEPRQMVSARISMLVSLIFPKLLFVVAVLGASQECRASLIKPGPN